MPLVTVSQGLPVKLHEWYSTLEIERADSLHPQLVFIVGERDWIGKIQGIGMGRFKESIPLV